jgi:probable HAF family extracellular repeat protein
VTLDITVNGSGYDQGSVVTLERQGVPAGKITTNATTFVTSRKLIANITIAADADTGKYDVAVTTLNNRKGVGIELFTVAYVLDQLGIIGGTWSRAHAINDRGEVVGASCTQDCLATAFYWSDATGLQDLGTLPGWSRSEAYAINNRGQVFGAVLCRSTDPGCGGVSSQQLVRWDRAGASWTITPVAGCSVVLPISEGSEKFLINNNDQCVSRTSDYRIMVLQTLSGGVVVNEEPLPSLFPGGINSAYGINDAAMVAGTGSDPTGPPLPVVWYRNATGAWVVLQLGFPGSDNRGQATDIGDADASGRVRVTGYTMNTNLCDRCGRTDPREQAVRWTLQPNGAGGWQVASIEALGHATLRGGTTNSWGKAVNNDGVVVGTVGVYFDSGSPFTWFASGMQSLPSLGGSGKGRATDINNQGWIVGAVWDNGNRCDRAAIWRQR